MGEVKRKRAKVDASHLEPKDVAALMAQHISKPRIAEALGVTHHALKHFCREHGLEYTQAQICEMRRLAALKNPNRNGRRPSPKQRPVNPEVDERKFRREATEGSAMLLERILATGMTHGPLA